MVESVVTIDLTESYTLINHNALSNTIIEIDDAEETFSEETIVLQSSPETPVRQPSRNTKEKKIINSHEKTPDAKIGNCPICCERLGKRPVSSTICGHIFCTECIKQAIQHDKRCPQCRKKMVGANKYHAIYLPLESK